MQFLLCRVYLCCAAVFVDCRKLVFFVANFYVSGLYAKLYYLLVYSVNLSVLLAYIDYMLIDVCVSVSKHVSFFPRSLSSLLFFCVCFRFGD